MLTPVICFTCGLPVGDVEDLFRVKRAALIAAALAAHDTDAAFAPLDAKLETECASILDELHITADCCRITLTNNCDFNDLY